MSEFIRVPDYTGRKVRYSFNMQQIEGEFARKQFSSRVIRAVKREDGTTRIDVRGTSPNWQIDINHDIVRELLLHPIIGYRTRGFILQHAPHLLEPPTQTETVETE